MCRLKSETIEYIISECQSVARIEYLKGHKFTANLIHQGLTLKQPKKITSQSVLENSQFRLYCDITIIT